MRGNHVTVCLRSKPMVGSWLVVTLRTSRRRPATSQCGCGGKRRCSDETGDPITYPRVAWWPFLAQSTNARSTPLRPKESKKYVEWMTGIQKLFVDSSHSVNIILAFLRPWNDQGSDPHSSQEWWFLFLPAVKIAGKGRWGFHRLNHWNVSDSWSDWSCGRPMPIQDTRYTCARMYPCATVRDRMWPYVCLCTVVARSPYFIKMIP